MWYKMKRKHSGYILATLFLSLCSYIVHLVSVLTESWVVAEASREGSIGNVSYINYGLYQGTLVRNQDNSTAEEKFILTITCLLNLNVCAWTCQSWDSLRIKEISALYNTGQVLYPCTDRWQHFLSILVAEGVSTSDQLSEVRKAFIDGVAWLATVVFVTLSGLVTLVALTLCTYNINHMPSNAWFSIHSLYFWYGGSSLLALTAVMTWSFEFSFKLSKNIGTVETIAGILDSNDKAHLGYSFWCQFGVVVIQGCCVMLLYYRGKLFDQRPTFVCPLASPSNNVIISHFS